MCGIFGFTGTPAAERLAQLRAALLHRGPDGCGELVREDVSIGCDRLAIVGRADGAQPLTSEDGRLHLVCNGEIYNHRQLRRDLEQRGHRFATSSDAEVVLHAWEDEGEAALTRLAGMFALALWDDSARSLVLARDHAGMKSLFYARHADRWWFASEAKALLLAGLPRSLDAAALDGLLRLGFVPGARTLFTGIQRLPAGHLLILSAAEPTLRPFAAPAGCLVNTAKTPLAVTLRERLRATVASHLAAEVPVGASLSGGLDSSLLVALMAEQAGPGVKTFAIGCPGDQDERPYARQVAEHCRTDHHEISVAASDLLPRLPRVIWNAEEPRTGPIVLNDLLFERAARDVGVILIGEGADELFGGYLRFKTALPPLGFLPAPLAARIYGTRKLGASGATAGADGDGSRPDALRTHLGRALAERGARRLQALLAYERETQLPNAHLPRVDLLSMAHALEARLPYLDPAIVALAAQVPLARKVGWLSEKQVLREAAGDLLPPAIVARRKQGQANPFRLWSRAGALETAAALLSPAVLRARGLFSPLPVERLLRRLQRDRGLPFDANRLHLLMLIEIWHRVFLDPADLRPPGVLDRSTLS